jgi:hypothetical protein
MSVSAYDYFCTCGYATASEANAIRHAAQWHATEEERTNRERLKDRIRTMISSLRGLSFDQAQ